MERVAVTTSEDRYAGMASELVAVGLQPIPVPCVTVRVAESDLIGEATSACEQADTIVLLASRPLDLMWGERPLPTTSFAVLGPAIASDVSSRGGRVSFVGDGDPRSFLEEVGVHLADRQVAMGHGATIDPKLLSALESACGNLASFPLYCSIPQPAPAEAEVVAAIFLSSVAVEGWVQGRGLSEVAVACLGSVTEGALERYDRRPDVTSPSQAYSELASSLAEWLRN